MGEPCTGEASRGSSAFTAALAVLAGAALMLGGCQADAPTIGSATSTLPPGTATPAPSVTRPPAPSDLPTAQTTFWAPSWRRAGSPGASTVGGHDLAVGVYRGTEYLHAVVANLEEAWSNGDDASAYARSSDGGLTWTDQLMLGGMGPAVAAPGQYVFAAFWAYECSGVGVSRNSAGGRASSWSEVKCLGRGLDLSSIWGPVMTATDSAVFVASRNDETHTAVWSSRDHGRTWTSVVLGRLKLDGGSWWGDVQVAASGRVAAVAWTEGASWDTDRGLSRIWVRMSTDAGLHWSKAQALWPEPGRVVSADASDGRLAFSGVSEEGPWLTLWTPEDGWMAVTAPAIATTEAGPVVALGTSARIGLMAGDCSLGDYGHVGTTRWVTSNDDGSTWLPIEHMPSCMQDPRLVWSATGSVYALHRDPDIDGEGYILSVGP